jgi:LacI family transcriptional regulator, galactose operon repressor
VKLGHRRIGMLLDNLDISTNVERLNGYRRALRENAIEPEDGLILSCQYTRQSAYELVASMVKDTHRPTALFTANNFMTIGALRAIYEAGLNVPQDIAMVGFDELEWIQLGSPAISTVAQPVMEIGQVAGQRILSRLRDGAGAPMEIRLKTRFLVRESSEAAPPEKTSNE